MRTCNRWIWFFLLLIFCVRLCVCAWLLLTLKMKRRTKGTHQFQRIPSSNRLNHLCKVRNYLEYHYPAIAKLQSTFLYRPSFLLLLLLLALRIVIIVKHFFLVFISS